MLWKECCQLIQQEREVRIPKPNIRDPEPACACSLKPNGELDDSSLHGSCPVTKGEKWSATKWIHVGVFGGNVKQAKAKWCAPASASPECATVLLLARDSPTLCMQVASSVDWEPHAPMCAHGAAGHAAASCASSNLLCTLFVQE